jgi:hypothetical protein
MIFAQPACVVAGFPGLTGRRNAMMVLLADDPAIHYFNCIC